jgi:antitoxin (DNA-binding transcriptional repressor) of toxin-antitoxin stability system
MPFNFLDAKTHLSRLLQLDEKWKEVISSRCGKPVVQLQPTNNKSRKLGSEAHLEPFPIDGRNR